MADPVSAAEVARHAAPDDCWVVVDGTVWDLTEFAPTHPGGADGMYLWLFSSPPHSLGRVGLHHHLAAMATLGMKPRSFGFSLPAFLRPRVTPPLPLPPLEAAR